MKCDETKKLHAFMDMEFDFCINVPNLGVFEVPESIQAIPLLGYPRGLRRRRARRGSPACRAGGASR